MNGRTISYWMVTGLMAAFMILSAIPDVARSEVAVTAFTHLGYPIYLLPFIGIAKIAGVAVVLLPSMGRVKEWAYAGLTFDLTGALYSHLSVGDPAGVWIFAVIGLILVTGSYFFGGSRHAPALHVSAGANGWE
jgi:hypothetical protein